MEPFLIGNSQAIRLLRKNILRISQYDLEVLVCGATGTGKGVVAQTLHNNSPRSGHQFLTINCANLPTYLKESEIFGYRRGAFIGAWPDKSGRFELAQNGTIFLDEISEISTSMQAKLLMVLQEKEFCPIGGVDSVPMKSRVVAATNADLKQVINQGAFRKDLYYRLAVVRLELPTLKNRKEDVPVLVHHFLDKYSRLYDKQEVPHLSDGFWDVFLAYDWPGNVRELESSIKSLVALENEELVREEVHKRLDRNHASGNSGEVLVGKIPAFGLNSSQEQPLQNMSLSEIVDQTASRIEAMLISKALEQTGGQKKMTAQVLDISYKSLLNKIKSFGL
ncbi:MAG: sigma-54 dependent transcriptional regulator [Desulfovermiculus sp.]|nr:sigma-54 dependent transcriptional regulator [Desulfovermiculus sp.]